MNLVKDFKMSGGIDDYSDWFFLGPAPTCDLCKKDMEIFGAFYRCPKHPSFVWKRDVWADSCNNPPVKYLVGTDPYEKEGSAFSTFLHYTGRAVGRSLKMAEQIEDIRFQAAVENLLTKPLMPQ